MSHAPGFFAAGGWLAGGGRLPAGERRRPRDVSKFDATAGAYALVGWEYRLLGAGGCAGDRKPTVVGWLSASPAPSAWTVDVLRRMFATPTPVMAGAEAAGDPIAVLPVLFISCGVTSLRAT